MAPKEKKDPNEIITMKAPEGGETATATRAAFDNIWKAKGYTLVGEDAAGGTPAESAKAGDK